MASPTAHEKAPMITLKYLLLVAAWLATIGPLSAAPRMVYMAIRTDGLSGHGTKADPFDGSTQARFDSRMKNIGWDTQINLSAGIFRTNGADAYLIKRGWKIQGSGMGKTVLRLVGHSSQAPKHIHLSSALLTDDIEIRDLTCDVSHDGFKWIPHQAIGGIFISGNNTLIENVEVKDCYGDAVLGLEQFSILIGGARGRPNGIVKNCVIRNCWTHDYAPGSTYTNGSIVACCENARIIDCRDDGANHAFGFAGTIHAQISGCKTTARTAAAYYIDTDSIDGLVIENNSFFSSQIPIQFNSAALAQNVTIQNNVLESSNSSGSGSAAIVLCGAKGFNFLITGNTFIYAGTNNSGLILNNGAPYKHLTVEHNASNVGLIGAGGAAVRCSQSHRPGTGQQIQSTRGESPGGAAARRESLVINGRRLRDDRLGRFPLESMVRPGGRFFFASALGQHVFTLDLIADDGDRVSAARAIVKGKANQICFPLIQTFTCEANAVGYFS